MHSVDGVWSFTPRIPDPLILEHERLHEERIELEKLIVQGGPSFTLSKGNIEKRMMHLQKPVFHHPNSFPHSH